MPAGVGGLVYKYIDQGVVDGVVNGSGAGGRGHAASSCASIQTGKVQQYGAYLFGGATVLAAIFVVIASERPRESHREGPARRLGPDRSPCSSRWWARW